MAAEDQAGFIQKTFGLFSVMILFQLIYVVLIALDEKSEGIKKFAGGMTALVTGIVMALIALVIVLMSKQASVPLPASKGYPSWLLFTVGMTLVAGYTAAKKDTMTILVAEIGTMVATVLCTLFGGRILASTGKTGFVSKLGPVFGIMSLVLVVVLIAAQALNIGGMGNAFILALVLCLVTAFFIIDVQLIVQGQYTAFTKDDYVMASMKLFADFVLIFGILLEMC